jgi:hypothetical protein
MTDFRHAMDTVLAELTPQPWTYGTPAGTLLTVIPAGIREDAGRAEVLIQIAASPTMAAEVGITTADLPGLITALDDSTEWRHTSSLNDRLAVSAADLGGIVLTLTEFDWTPAGREEVEVAVRLPAEQRLPLASALRRALDVARGWEDES